jgi:iron(III) transport system ATP-binding protein
MAELLRVVQCGVSFGTKPVVRQVSFQLNAGTIGCLLGPSGCGKTTLLRTIAGFEPLDSGEIHLHGQLVGRQGWQLPPERRRVGMVFQDFALFPHLRVDDNVGFGIRHLSSTQRKARVAELLELIGLGNCGELYPHQLSGGQQQRVALARAIAPKPALLLLDEPFSGMDAEMREQLARDVRRILKLEAVTAILVTHDQLEAFAMADEIGVMSDGRIAQWDSSYNLYHQPATRFVADFIGQGVLLPGTVVNDHEARIELGNVAGDIPTGCTPDCPVDVLVRPDDVLHDDDSPLKAMVSDKAFRGAEFLYTLRLDSGATVLCLAPSHHDHKIGEKIGIRLAIDHLVMFKRPGSKTISPDARPLLQSTT